MTITTPSPGDVVREHPEGTFIRIADLPGTDSARRNALSQASKKGELVRARNGLYFKGVKTRFGMTGPSASDVAREVLTGGGFGPAGYSAARHLGLTTQVPAEPHFAFAGPLPAGVSGVRLHRRNNRRRWELNETEIALLEVLRDPANYSERGWASLVDAAGDRIRAGLLRMDKLTDAVEHEAPVATRANFGRLVKDLA